MRGVLDWVLQNRWLFDGVGGAAALAGLGAIWKMGRNRWRETRSIPLANDPDPIAYAPVTRRPPLSTRVPAVILRLFTSPTRVRSRILIGLREENPIALSLGASIPLIDLYFEITNLSPIDLILD